jgi:hypothetical protein
MGKLSAVTNALGVLFHRTSPATQAQPPPVHHSSAIEYRREFALKCLSKRDLVDEEALAAQMTQVGDTDDLFRAHILMQKILRFTSPSLYRPTRSSLRSTRRSKPWPTCYRCSSSSPVILPRASPGPLRRRRGRGHGRARAHAHAADAVAAVLARAAPAALAHAPAPRREHVRADVRGRAGVPRPHRGPRGGAYKHGQGKAVALLVPALRSIVSTSTRRSRGSRRQTTIALVKVKSWFLPGTTIGSTRSSSASWTPSDRPGSRFRSSAARSSSAAGSTWTASCSTTQWPATPGRSRSSPTRRKS